jgi:threonine aldolase
MPARLHDDHANARWMAEQIAGMGGCMIDLETVQTNIVIFRPEGRTAAEIVAGLKAQGGVLCGTASAEEVRFVTHHDVDRTACERAIFALHQVLA